VLCQHSRIPKDAHTVLGPGQSDVQAPRIIQKTDSLGKKRGGGG
jgi:hypothetical protein